jgi:hypothetical protein
MTEPIGDAGLFMRRPQLQEARRVTSENFEEVAAWCEGDIFGESTDDPYIRVPHKGNKSRDLVEAHIGQWIFKIRKTCAVYAHSYIMKNFIRVEADAAGLVNPTPSKQTEHCCHHESNVTPLPNAPRPPKFNGNNRRRHMG